MNDPTGQSPADHEDTTLEPDERDDEVLTMTRRQLRIITYTLLDLIRPRIDKQVRESVVEILKTHVRLDAVTPEEIAR